MGSITKQFVSGHVEPVGFGIAVDSVGKAFEKAYCNNDYFLMRKIFNPNEQENEMNTKVFEYCIINFHDSGAPEVVVGPEVIATLGEENPRDVALLRIGRRHADVINEDSEVQIRPFC